MLAVKTSKILSKEEEVEQMHCLKKRETTSRASEGAVEH